MLTQREQRKAAKEFAKRWEGIGYEKGDSQRFWMSLLNEVYGVKKPAEYIRFEDQVKLDRTSFIDGIIPSTHVLIEQKSINKDLSKPIRQSDGSLLSPFQQAKRYSIELPYDDRPRWIVLSNFKEFHIYDMNKPQSEPEIVYLKDLEEDYYRLNFLVDQEDDYVKRAVEVSIQAGSLVGTLYDALLKQYQDPKDEKTLRDLNVLCVRLVFCFYAEDAGLFGRYHMFNDYLSKFRDDPYSFRDALIRLFKVLDQEEHERDPYLSDELLAFPYVNGGLFENENLVVPRVNEEIIDIILNKASDNFDWSNISPTIFGGVFESTLNPETRRSGGMHYTSIENIHKVIDPLFMNGLREEFKEAVSLKTLSAKTRRLEDLQNKIASLKFLDPAAGSGNFLTETYISLRKLENEILKELLGSQIIMGEIHNPIKVSISQFYGIEINDFAVSVARTALWIAESQMMKETEDIVNMNLDFLPLKTYPNIVEGNALRIDWEDVVSKDELDYIMGNPPFYGQKLQTLSQKDDMNTVFDDLPKYKRLDYVSAWFKKSSEFIFGTNIKAGLVSTNSIVQGEMINLLWDYLTNKYKINIFFAHRTFIWNSQANDKANVHCVIIGFSFINVENKYIFDNGISTKADNINAYLLDAPDIFMPRTTKSISMLPHISKGSQIVDGGNYVFNNEEEYKEFVLKEPNSKKYIYKYLNARDFLNNKNQMYILYFKDYLPEEINKLTLVKSRIDAVKQYREESSSPTFNKLADQPMKYFVTLVPSVRSIVFPCVSSSNRKYIPIDFIDKETIITNSMFYIESDDLSLFALLMSNVHMSWLRVFGGRLKSDYRYSSTMVYNTLPVPKINDIQKQKLEKTANNILNARNMYPNSSLADLYNELTMPPELRKAHQENDKAVMETYGFDWKTMTESECVAELMKLYQEAVSDKK